MRQLYLKTYSDQVTSVFWWQVYYETAANETYFRKCFSILQQFNRKFRNTKYKAIVTSLVLNYTLITITFVEVNLVYHTRLMKYQLDSCNNGFNYAFFTLEVKY